MSSAREWLTAYRRESEERLGVAKSREARWSWARLATFFAAATVWYPLRHNWPVALAAAATAFLLFVLAVREHLGTRHHRLFLERLLAVLKDALQRCEGQVAVVRPCHRPDTRAPVAPPLRPQLEPGSTWPLSHQEIEDLDLYAPPVGIFGLLNRASTLLGAQRLGDMLTNPCLEIPRIIERQQAVRWLEQNRRERLRFMASAAALRNHDDYLSALHTASASAEPLPWSTATLWTLRVWSFLSLAFVLLAAFKILSGFYDWSVGLMLLAMVNSVIYLRTAPVVSSAVRPWKALKTVAVLYHHTARRGAAELPEDTPLSHLQSVFALLLKPGSLPAICRRLGWTDAGGFFHVLTNHLFFYDLHVAATVLSTVLPCRDQLIAGLSALADTEALCSLACFADEQPLKCYPTPVGQPRLAITHGVHPLIAPEHVVSNDVRLTETMRTWIITGSNMAGKSTLLRMAGINTLLAQMGTVATARQMEWCPLRLLTDLRIRDDLAKEESYFLAEVRQLRRMVLPESDSAPVLGLMDEPFRGTNSQERVAASVALVGHLLSSEDFFLLATHEQTLTTLVDGRAAANYHFAEDLGSAGEVFDYRLRSGPARQRNALRILQREGFPDSLVANARAKIKMKKGQRLPLIP